MTDLEALRKNINNLEREGASPEIFDDLNVLAMAVLWSEESWKIVHDAAELVRDNHIIAPGHWR